MCIVSGDPNSQDFLQSKRSQRLKLWEITPYWHCAVIGTCLGHDELVKIARKCGYEIPKGKGASFQMHSMMVGEAENTNGAARLLHKAIEKKYKRAVREFSLADSFEKLDLLWDKAMEEGDVAGAFWAILTHPDASEDFKRYVYGDVHMLSHLEGGQKRNELQQMKKIRENETRMEQYLVAARRNLMNKQSEVIELKDQLKAYPDVLQKNQELEEKLLVLEEGQMLAQLEQRVEILSNRVILESERVQFHKNKHLEIEEENKKLSQELSEKDNRIFQLEEDLLKTVSQQKSNCKTDVTACSGDENCAGNSDLCGRCIAYIGGQTKLAAFFRDHVEDMNGEFLHHDGGLHDGQARLLNIIKQADAVMFPVTCISHEASREIKQACIQCQKPFIPLRSKGLGAFKRGVESLQDEFFDKTQDVSGE